MIGMLVRSAGAIIASLVVAMVLIIAVEIITTMFHPFPADVDITDPEVVAAHVAKCPHWVLALAVVGWGVTVFASAWLATRLGSGRHHAHGISVGSLLFLAAAFNMFMLPYPAWFVIANVLILPLGIFGAVRIASGRRSKKPRAVV